ncbi:MAG: hypothetical protein OSB00_15680 [Sphingomonas bacterium]|nr:hypothetical protein [Sphingomonas bacterium]
MSALAAWAVEAFIASTLLMVLVLAIRGTVRRHFGPQIAYCLWAAPLLRLLMPPIPAAWREAVATPISRAGETITIIMVDPAGSATAVPVAAFPSLGLIISTLWATGAVVFLGWHLVRHNLFCRRIIGGAANVERVGSVRIVESDDAPGPLAFGIVRRYVAFPRDFAGRYDADERDLALAHEIGHHERGDLIANWIALGVLSLHWCNPVAWRAFRAFRSDQELANDARVLAGRNPIDRHHYACAIVKAAHGGAVSAACHLHTIDDLKGRLKMLTTSPTSRRRLAAGTACVALLATTGLALTASGTRAAAAITTRVGETIGVDTQAPPAPPAPPAAPEAVDAPPAPPAPATDAPEAKIRHVVVKRIDKNGKVTTKTSESIDGLSDPETEAMVKRALANTPDVRERNCTDADGGTDRQVTINRQEGDKRFMIICTNRVEKIAADAAKTAAQSAVVQKSAMNAAMAGIVAARQSILAERNLTEAQRREALKGLDEAIVEMRAEQAKNGD